MALFNICGWNICAIYGVSLMASGRAAILGYTMPIWSVALSVWLLGERFTRRRALGVALGLSGMLFLLGGEIRAVGVRRWARYSCWARLHVGPGDGHHETLAGGPSGEQPDRVADGDRPGPYPGHCALCRAGPLQPLRPFDRPLLGVLFNLVVAFNFCYWAWYKIVLLARWVSPASP